MQLCTCEGIWLVFLLLLLLHDKYSPLYFYYYTECRHFPTSRGRSCNSPCSSVNPVCWSTIELGVLFSSYYFKINWKTNHSNHFEIKKPHPNPTTQNPNQMFVQRMTWKKILLNHNKTVLHWLIYCGWNIDRLSLECCFCKFWWFKDPAALSVIVTASNHLMLVAVCL